MSKDPLHSELDLACRQLDEAILEVANVVSDHSVEYLLFGLVAGDKIRVHEILEAARALESARKRRGLADQRVLDAIEVIDRNTQPENPR